MRLDTLGQDGWDSLATSSQRIRRMLLSLGDFLWRCNAYRRWLCWLVTVSYLSRLVGCSGKTEGEKPLML